MAGPMVHTIGTLPWFALWYFYSQSALNFVCILFFGVLLDFVDHFSMARLKKLAEGDTEPIEGCRAWLHIWLAAYIISGGFLGLFLYAGRADMLLPLISYWAHQLIDGPGNYRSGHLPHDIHYFYPEWIWYKTSPPMIFRVIKKISDWRKE